MNKEIFYLITFKSTHSAIKAEKQLLSIGLQIRIIPVPTEITASCGLAIRVKEEDFHEAKQRLDKDKVDMDGCYLIKKYGINKEVIKI